MASRRSKRFMSTTGKRFKPPNANWRLMIERIEEMRKGKTAAVDSMGVDSFTDANLYPPHVNRFRTLIAAMLSSQTKDQVNAAAMKRLTEYGLTVESMLAISQEELSQLLHPVSFYKNKAKYIKKTCEILQQQAINTDVVDIPHSLTDLLALPGVGPKMAHLIMTCAWQETHGICVDIHVHRISNRLGWVNTWKNAKSQDPEKTRKELEEWLPRDQWGTINPLLVGFGQTICTAMRPKCDGCSLNDICPSAAKVYKTQV